MSRRLVSFMALLAFAATPVLAQQTCPDGKPRDVKAIADRIDLYARDPFSARTWRVLKGLGDPMIDPQVGWYSSYEDAQGFRNLVAEIMPDVKQPDYYGYECRLGYPKQVLDKRIADLGKTSPYVKQWITVQMAVVAACNDKKLTELPAPLTDQPANIKDLQDADRAYQYASLIFYTDRERATQLYRLIGNSPSPHKAAARYMVANILANGKQFDAARREANDILADQSLASVHVITRELLGYIANLEDTAAGWTSLLDSTAATLDKPTKEILASDALKADYARALGDIDFAGIRTKYDDWWLDGKLPQNPTISKAIVDASRKHPIVPWMIAGQTINSYYTALPWQFIGPKWEERTSSYIDRSLGLVSGTPPLARDVIEALKAKSDPASRKALWDKAIAAATKTETSCGEAPETAAAATLLTHAVRVSALAGDFDEAYAGLEAYPVKADYAYAQGTVRALGQYLMGQGNVQEARRFRDRILTDEFLTSLGSEPNSYNDGFALLMMWMAEDRAHWEAALAKNPTKTQAAVLNFLPAKDLRKLAGNDKIFSEEERALLIRAAWARLWTRGKLPEKSFTDEFFALNPKIKAVADKVATDYPKASDANRRLMTMLRTPRLGILVNAPGQWDMVAMQPVDDVTQIDSWDHNDKNWWCPFETDRQLLGLRDEYDTMTGVDREQWWQKEIGPYLEPDVMKRLAERRESVLKNNPAVKGVSWGEISALSKMPSGPKRLTEAAIKWGRASKGDDGAPEALARAVKTTRYGCNWHGGHGRYSSQAHAILHQKFGTTTWATETPYWFDCVNFYLQSDTKTDKCPAPVWPKQPLPR
ncbi:MAG: hypothetical protein AB7F76_16990 [Parvibaculaceae bacterium]